MDIARRLTAATRRKDFQPNVELAIELVDTWDEAAVQQVFELVENGSKRQAHDAIQVAFEIAQREPELIQPHLDTLIDLLRSRDNRLLWGALYALSGLVAIDAKRLYAHLDQILDGAARASVIGRDKTLVILVGLMRTKRYTKRITPLLLAHVQAAAINQFPTYAEAAATCLPDNALPALVKLIKARRDLAEYPAKQKRMQRLLAGLAKRLG